MKRLLGTTAVLAVAGLIGMAVAQQIEQNDGVKTAPQRGQRGQRGDRMSRPGQGPEHRPPPPIIAALDVDKNQELSAEEIANASAALLTLDRDGDGALSNDEMRPPRPPRGEGFVEHVMSFDEDGDGLVTKDEMPERMLRLLERGDTNADGAIDETEATAVAEEMQGRQRPGGGKRGRGGQRPGRGSQP